MKYTDELSKHYESLLSGQYDCVDRIVLNAYCPMLLTGGGVRNWYRVIKGSDQGLDTNALMRFAGKFSRRVQAYAKKEGIPFVCFSPGERKHVQAEALQPPDKAFTGIFAIFCSRAPSLLWEVKKRKTGHIHLCRKEKTSFVNHYFFHIMDGQWGHITVRICSHPPFSCNVILNGHEWVERQSAVKKLSLKKQDNCFISYSDGEKLSLIADTLTTKGQLRKVCQRWVYRCLWFAMDYAQQKATGFQYEYSVYQIEYSRNLLFKRGTQLDDVYQNIITLTRQRLDIAHLRTIFGKKRRPYKRKSQASAPEVRIETPEYNLTILKINFGKLTVKLYDKGERTLRAEVVVHNAKELGCKRSIGFFADIVKKLQQLMLGFMNNLEYAHAAVIKDGTLQDLTTPSKTGKDRLAGIDLNKKRNIALLQVVLALSLKPQGFTSADVTEKMRKMLGKEYVSRMAAYDLRKLRAKGLVLKQKGKIKYNTTPQGIQTIAAILCFWQLELPALLAAINHETLSEKHKTLSPVEKHIINAQTEIKKLKEIYGIKNAA